MQILILLGIILINYILISIGKKFNLLNIMLQLIGAMIVVPIFSIYSSVDVNQLINNDIIKNVYNFSFVLLIAYILHDNIDCNYQKKDIKLVIPSFFIPFISGVIFSYFWYGLFILKVSIVFGVIFSITAVPVLYMYLNNMNYSNEDKKFFIQTAVMIDVFSWLINSFTMDFNPIIIILCLISICSAFLVNYIKPSLSGLVFVLILGITSYFKSNVLLVGVLFVLISSYLKKPISLIIKDEYMNKINTYILIPLILFIGLLKVNWKQINIDLNLLTIMIILLPILTKIIGNYIGLILVKKENKLKTSILLNTRGLTEIVFLNLVFEFKLIDNKLYILFLIMSLISTLLPTIKWNK